MLNPMTATVSPPFFMLCHRSAFGFAMLSCALLVAPAQAQRTPAPTPASLGTVAPPAAAASAAGGFNAVTSTLQKAGVVRCSKQIQKVTDFLASKSHIGTMVFPTASNPDDSLVSISSEIISGTTLTYASANFAPRADGGSAEYEQVSHWSNSCDDVFTVNYINFKPMGVLQQQITVFYTNPATRVMMIPAGTGCVVIKKEIVH